MINNTLATEAIHFSKCLPFIFETNIEFMNTLQYVHLVLIQIAVLSSIYAIQILLPVT